MDEQPKRTALRYHGGKWVLAPWIISHLPKHRIYVEPFGGAMSVLLRKPRTYSEVYNDLDGHVVEFFRVLRDASQSQRLAELLRLTPFARDEFSAAYEHADCPVERARRMVIRSFMGFGSGATSIEYNTGFRSNSNRSGTTPAHDWAHYPESLKAITERLRGVVIENRAAVEIIQQHDSPEALFYADPPYVLGTRNTSGGVYRHEMSDSDHEELASVLKRVCGMVVLSGYSGELYEGLYADWAQVRRKALADGAAKRVEVLWLNKAALAGRVQGEIL